MSRTPSSGPPNSSPTNSSGELRRGTVVGRYVVLEQIGMGGMGVVYAAYDPELDRKLALKLLRPEREDAVARGRLLREAQALARLSHPNVLAVHDVGTYGDQVFLALEYVEGQSLAQWLRRGPHPWRQVLSVFQDVGRGVAAAHRAGVVHRDFKPSNVLLGEDGRPRVLDFGMARASGEGGRRRDREIGLPSSPATPVSLEHPLTQDGPMVGTLPYMAPEMPRGGAVDARSDQFSFCVALYEALYGEHPFADSGESTLVLIDRILRAEIKAPPAGTEIPGWVRSALVRGLSVNPVDRFSSMEALLTALEDRPWRRRRPLMATAAIAAVLAALALGPWHFGEPPPAQCRALEVRHDAVWGPWRAELLETRFSASVSPRELALWHRLEEQLNEQSRRWRATLAASCRQARMHRLPPDLFDRQLHCLERQLYRLAAFTDLLEHPLEGDLAETLHRVGRPSVLNNVLVESGDCQDRDQLPGLAPRPRDVTSEERLHRLERSLARGEVWTDAGLHRQALPEVLAAAREAREVGAPRLGAEALLLAGEIQRWQNAPGAARKSLVDALSRAETARDDRLAARVLIRLVWLDGVQQGDAEQGADWARLAEAKISRVDGSKGDLEILLVQAESFSLRQQGRLTEARRRLEEARATVLGPGSSALSRAQMADALGTVLLAQGEPRQALERFREAVDLRRRELGSDHPLVALGRDHVGSALRVLGRPAEALEEHRAAEAALRDVVGVTHQYAPRLLNNIAASLNALGRPEEALEILREVDARLAAASAPAGATTEASRHRLWAGLYRAEALGQMGRLHEAENAVAEVVARARESSSDGFAGTTLLARALEIQGELRLAQDRPAEALASLERAVALREPLEGDPGRLADSRFLLARALASLGRDPGRSHRLALQAREVFLRDERFAECLEQVEAWLAARPASRDTLDLPLGSETAWLEGRSVPRPGSMDRDGGHRAPRRESATVRQAG